MKAKPGKRPHKSMDELTKGYPEFIKGKVINPNHKADFEKLAKGERAKPISPKGHQTSQ